MDGKTIFTVIVLMIATVVVLALVYIYLMPSKPATKCGDKACQIGEDTSNCCIDCGCLKPGELCNIQKNKCELKEISLTDDRAIELATKYFEDQGLIVTSASVLGTFTYQNQLVKSVIINIEGEEEHRSILIMENETVIPASTHPT
jgi:hypothetical protein